MGLSFSTPIFLIFIPFVSGVPVKGKVKSLSRVRLFATQWTVAYQAPPSMGFFRQEYWSGLPFPAPGGLPNPGIEPRFPRIEGRHFNLWATSEAQNPPIFHLALLLYLRTTYSHPSRAPVLLHPSRGWCPGLLDRCASPGNSGQMPHWLPHPRKPENTMSHQL